MLRKPVLDAAALLPSANKLEAMPTAEVSTYVEVKHHIKHRVHDARKAQKFGSRKFRSYAGVPSRHMPGSATRSLIATATQ